ncbi:hypothetical protein A3Q56_05390 [Intoshia linei]|uniref:FHA domain-containing protein n=1 Tax=Intoshia linei TaxID=1819745 RepID=A0A177AZT3_9BILA|nr:hypothetical protein A3Q56_05390 [Intoshia linei]
MSSRSRKRRRNIIEEEEKNVEVNKFECPKWAGKPEIGLHVDIIKEGSVKSKIIIDSKKCYFFGRNKEMCDFHTYHSSCSRIHAALVWHSKVKKPFLMDLGSTHGTFICNERIEPNIFKVVEFDVEFRFGVSTRKYIIRCRPKGSIEHLNRAINNINESLNISLPASNIELDNLTEFNTARNQRLDKIVILDNANSTIRKKHKNRVKFSNIDDIINPEDVDPSIGRFQNLVSTTFVQKRKGLQQASMQNASALSFDAMNNRKVTRTSKSTTDDYEDYTFKTNSTNIPNLAPVVIDQGDQYELSLVISKNKEIIVPEELPDSDRIYTKTSRKVYAKESWPGRKSGLNSLI